MLTDYDKSFYWVFKCLIHSEIRDIPDNQEVFCHINTDQSIIVDILEYQSQVEGESAVR